MESYRQDLAAYLGEVRRIRARVVRGLVRGRWDVTDSGRDARFYAMTPAGSRWLADEIARWDSYVRAMGRVLRPGSSR